jgi:hypothetical protein
VLYDYVAIFHVLGDESHASVCFKFDFDFKFLIFFVISF